MVEIFLGCTKARVDSPTGRASHSGQDLLSRLAGFRFRSYGTIFSYTPWLCVCSSVLVLFRCFLLSASAPAAWRTSTTWQREPRVIPMCDKLSDPSHLLRLAAFIRSPHRHHFVPSATHFRRGASPIRLRRRSTKRTDDARRSSSTVNCSLGCSLSCLRCCALGACPAVAITPEQHRRS